MLDGDDPFDETTMLDDDEREFESGPEFDEATEPQPVASSAVQAVARDDGPVVGDALSCRR